MADIKQAFGSSTGITITLASLADNTARESAYVDNATNLFLDVLVQLHVKLAAGTPVNEKAIYIWAYGSEDGTNYTDNATGADAGLTLRSPHNLKLLGIINCPDTGGLTYKSSPISIAQAFGGIMPRRWGIVVENQTGIAFDSSGHAKAYSGVYMTG